MNRIVAAIILLAALAACRPQIGDPCNTSIECPEGAACDTTATGGYCLSYDCLDSGCPEGAVCVPFRTFSACMQYCASDDDCRVSDGQVCRNDVPPTPFCYHMTQEP